jgi:NADH:ubiquinone oxidoreductase subunit 2 (subunit N)
MSCELSSSNLKFFSWFKIVDANISLFCFISVLKPLIFEENSEKRRKIQKKILKRYGKYGTKVSLIVIRYGQYGRKIS